MERVHEIVFQGRVDGLRIVLGLEARFVDADQFLSFTGLFAETVIGDAIEPGRKFRLAAKAADVFVSTQESFLREVIREGEVGARELAQKTTHGRLVIAHQFGDGVMIIVDQDPRDEIGIIQRHLRSLHLGGRLSAVNVEFPDQEIPKTDHKRNDADAPDAAVPVVHGPEKNDQSGADHKENDTAA